VARCGIRWKAEPNRQILSRVLRRLLVLLATCAACGAATGLDVSKGGDEGTSDAGGVDSALPPTGPAAAPRQIAPLSTATVTSQMPTLRWSLASGTDGAQVDVCRDRACSSLVTTFVASGSTGAPAKALAPGVYFWRVHGVAAGVVGAATSAVWQFWVGARSAPVDSSWGTVPDVNGDGFADVLVGGGGGPFSVYLGSAAGPSSESTGAIDGASGFDDDIVTSAGDVNGDGFADVAFLTLGPDYVHVYFGGPSGVAGPPSTTLTDPANGPQGNITWVNSMSAAGDVNGDGYGDLLVGAVCEPCAGGAYVYLGGPSGLGGTPATTIDVTMLSSSGGYVSIMAGAGDVDGDGFADVLLGRSVRYGLPGEVDVFMGSANGIATSPELTLTNPGLTFYSFGDAVSGVGDVDGDGYADIVVGASDGSRPSSSWGAYVYLGSATGLTNSIAVSLSVDYPSIGDFGAVVAGRGDVNGDGYSDIVVGTPLNVDRTGYVDVFLGGATGPSTMSSASFSNVGPMVSISGDVNGDSFDDLVIGDSALNQVDLHLGSPIGPVQAVQQTWTDPGASEMFEFGFSVD
jgi:hypothetical protein